MAIERRVRVEAIAAGGDGVARIDGLVTFIPRTAPGDLVDVTLEPRGRFARGSVVRLVEPSHLRVEPRCRHYERDRCGGCQLQHLAYEAQLAAKRQIAADALVRIGRRQVAVPPVVASPLPWEYRNRLTLVVRLNLDGTRVCGLHRYDAPDRVFDLEECPISKPQIVSAVAEVRRAAHLLPEVRQLRVTLRSHREGILMVLEGAGQWASQERFRSACPSLAKVVWRLPEPAPDTAGAASEAAESIVFEQVNPAVAKLLRELLVEWVLDSGPRTIVDAYCGTGETAVALSQRGMQVIGIERQPEAAALAAARLPPGRVITARVEDALPSVLPADVVIVNPPRSGLSRQVTEILGRDNAASRILYVSCDPATLARDLSRLPSYRVGRVVCFDMFPQTAHLETVCELVREA